MSKHAINPHELFNSLQYGFSQIVVSPPSGRMIHLSGQVAWDADRNIVARGDLSAQVIQSLKNVELGLRLAGASLADVVSLRIYIKHSHMSESRAISAGLKQFFGDQPPCSTWIGVPGLANDDFLIEIEPVAIVYGESHDQTT